MGESNNFGGPAEPPRPLHLLTTDALLDHLILGKSVATGPSDQFSLHSVEARAVLDWYRRNRIRWTANLQSVDAEAIVDSLARKALQRGSAESERSGRGKTLRLVKLVAHRFAGLHAYGTPAEPPIDFVFEPERPLTLFEGWNGSGKTSLANAIIWCLTGQVLRPQRAPEDGVNEFQCVVDRDGHEDSQHLLSSVTPLPDASIYAPEASAKTVPVDTWVELTFQDETMAVLRPIRRSQSRKPSGKIVEVPPDLDELGIDPISYRLGTTIPSLLPYLQVGGPSELGLAVARLTGLADLIDLAKHATKARVRISGQLVKDRVAERDELQDRLEELKAELDRQMIDFPAMRPASSIQIDVDTSDEDARAQVLAFDAHFLSLKGKGLVAARDVLGPGFAVDNTKARESLEQKIGPAREQIKNVLQLPSIARLAALKLGKDEIDYTRALLIQLRYEAASLAELSADPRVGRRKQLYARVASWMVEHNQNQTDHCAVCHASINGVVDPDTGVNVSEHLRNAKSDREFLSKTVAQWVSGWTGAMARDLPQSLREELTQDLPSSPLELIQIGFTDDLFKTEGFTGALSALRPGVKELVRNQLAVLPPFVEPVVPLFPSAIARAVVSLQKIVLRVERALAFAAWSFTHREEIATAIVAIRRGSVGTLELDDAIGPRLDRLAHIVKGVAPISNAISIVSRMALVVEERSKKAQRIEACSKASEALAEIIPIGVLAQAQVETLRAKLHNRSEYWRKLIYQNATSFAPTLRETVMDAKGVIDISVGRSGVSAPVQHVSNASALRASLFGFFLAFREYVMQVRGGLNLIVLDDPQDLLDHDNRQRLARALVKLVNANTQLLVTTHDRAFARTLVDESRSDDLVAHRSMHPVNASRLTLATSLAVEELDRKRNDFEKNIDSATHAQEYVGEARVFLETRLGDLFDDPAFPAFSTTTRAMTMISLVDRLRGLIGAKSNELFKSSVLARFCEDPAFSDGADARRVLNGSHHDRASISYEDVKRIEVDLRRLRSGIEKVHEEFRRHRWREPLLDSEIPANVVRLHSVKVPAFDVPLCPDIAAFQGGIPSGGSQDVPSEQIKSAWFDNKALFYIRHSTLGLAIPAGNIAIVEDEPTIGGDHSLVVARHNKQTFARRLLKGKSGEGVSLAVEMIDSRSTRPTLSFSENALAVHRVVGVLFSRMAPPEGREEATKIESAQEISRVKVAYRVRESSAVPVALPGQVILCGGELSISDLDGLVGQIVAVVVADGTSLLKRVGARLPGSLSHLRLFETVGGLGGSVVIATEDLEDGLTVPVMRTARSVIGVLYQV